MSERMSIGILNDYQHAALRSADWSALQKNCDITVVDRTVDAVGDIDLLKEFEVISIMRERTPFPRSLFEKLPALRLLVTTATGNAAVDLNAARDHGVVVCGTANGDGRRITAELAWGLVIAATRGIVAEDRSVREGAWQVGVGIGLWGRVLGLYGLGHVGTMMAGYGRAFGMDVIAWSENLTPDRASAVGARHVSRDALFRQADVLSIHQVLSDRTRASVGKAEFDLMKPSAVLVNTSRGQIIDTDELLAALNAGRIRAAALDVFSQEPLPKNDPLRLHPRLVITPHIGYVEQEIYKTFFVDTVAAIEAYLRGETPARVLNPKGKDLGPNLASP